MKIGMQTWGVDGDVNPFLSLAIGLRKKGHDVVLAVTTPSFKDYSEIAEKWSFEILHTAKGRGTSMDELRNLPLEAFDNYLSHFYDEMREASIVLCEQCDIVIGNDQTLTLLCRAEKKGIPFISLSYVHYFIPSDYLMPPDVPSVESPKVIADTWNRVREEYNRRFLHEVNKVRKSEDLPPVANVLEEITYSPTLNLIAVSSVFCKQQIDWTHHQVVGYFNPYDEIEELPSALIDFINQGTAPVFFTGGSTAYYERPDTLIDFFLKAQRAVGFRAIIQVMQSDLPHCPNVPDIFWIGKVQYTSIFPMCAAVVHHGGVGTAHLATLCGCPSVVMEFYGHQWFVGKELNRIGIAPELLHRYTLTAEDLTMAIETVLGSGEMKAKAMEYAKIMKQENGVTNAVKIIEERFTKVTQKVIRIENHVTTAQDLESI